MLIYKNIIIIRLINKYNLHIITAGPTPSQIF